MKKVISLILSTLLLLVFFVGCVKDETDPGGGDGDNSDPPKKEFEYTQIVVDPDFKEGFVVRSQTEGLATPIGEIGYEEGKEYNPKWQLAQWASGYYHRENVELYDQFNILNGVRSFQNGTYSFVDKSKTFRVNPDSGSIYMKLNAGEEYINPRVDGQPWPHILLEYAVQPGNKLCEIEEAKITFDFTMTRYKSMFTNPSQEKDLHTAQFVYYIVLSNRNVNSPDYGRYIWFGLNFFDRRHDFTPAFAAQDGGKEQNTGAYIYVVGARNYLEVPTSVGERQLVEYDMFPSMRDAFNSAQQNNFLVNTKWEDLELGGGNYGFEITGTYELAMQIDNYELNIGKVKAA